MIISTRLIFLDWCMMTLIFEIMWNCQTAPSSTKHFSNLLLVWTLILRSAIAIPMSLISSLYDPRCLHTSSALKSLILTYNYFLECIYILDLAMGGSLNYEYLRTHFGPHLDLNKLAKFKLIKMLLIIEFGYPFAQPLYK